MYEGNDHIFSDGIMKSDYELTFGQPILYVCHAYSKNIENQRNTGIMYSKAFLGAFRDTIPPYIKFNTRSRCIVV